MRIPRRRDGAHRALNPSAWSFAAILAALLGPWLTAGTRGMLSAQERLRRGLTTLCALALVIVILAVTSAAPMLAPLAAALGAWLALIAAAALTWTAPALARGLRRVRTPAFRASLARVTQLPRWYVMPAAVVGGAAEEIVGRAHALQAMEVRTGAAWLASGIAALLGVAVHLPRASLGGWAAGALTAATVAGLIAWHRRLGAAR